MRRVSATVGRTRVAYAGGHAGGYGLPAGPGEILGREVWEALKKAVERWNAALAKEYSR